ncbi:hypothetical protein AVEN_165655-1, partial [Araneus ventricosus]
MSSSLVMTEHALYVLHIYAASQSYVNRDGLPVSTEKKPQPPARSLVCQECSGGTFFGIYHTPTSRRKTTESLPVGSLPNESRWERTSLP